MGDRSYATLTVYRALGPDRLAIQRILDQELGNPPSIITDGEEIAIEEMSLGGMADICRQIYEIAPNAVFEGQQAEYGDIAGDWSLNTPETGFRQFEQDQAENITLTHNALILLLDEALALVMQEYHESDQGASALYEEIYKRAKDQMGRNAYEAIDKYRHPDVPPKFNTQEEADAWLESRISTP